MVFSLNMFIWVVATQSDVNSSPNVDEIALNSFRNILKKSKKGNECYLLSRMLQSPSFDYLFPLIADQSPERIAGEENHMFLLFFFFSSLNLWQRCFNSEITTVLYGVAKEIGPHL